jgi:hypothetical protein
MYHRLRYPPEILQYPPRRRKTSQAPTLTLPRGRGRELGLGFALSFVTRIA